MAYIRYPIYPDSPEATDYSRSSAYMLTMFRGFAVLGTIAIVIYFVNETVSLFSQLDFKEFIDSLELLLIAGIVDLLYIFAEKANDRELTIILAKSQKHKYSPEQLVYFERQLKAESKMQNKDFAKRYFLFFLGGILCVIGLIGIIMGIYFMCHGKPGIALMICSIIGTGIIVEAVWLLYKKIAGISGSIELPSSRKTANRSDSMSFCHKCGTKLLPDSLYCPKCGIKIKA